MAIQKINQKNKDPNNISNLANFELALLDFGA